MGLSRQVATRAVMALVLVTMSLRADPGDVESSHDYPGWTRLPGYLISDYDEDNPAVFDFPIARPVAVDANHIDTVRVRGHRYVIRYELGPGGRGKSVYETQQYYEKIAATAGFSVQKDGGVGDVTETFCKTSDTQALWIYLEPTVGAMVITVVESNGAAPPPPQRLATDTPKATGPKSLRPADTNPMTVNISTLPKAPPPAYMLTDDSSPGSVAAGVSDPLPAEPALLPGAKAPPPPPDDLTLPNSKPPVLQAEIAKQEPPSHPSAAAIAATFPDVDTMPPDEPEIPRTSTPEVVADDTLYSALSDDGRVVVPFVFTPGKDDLNDSSQDLIDRIVVMMKAHPDLQLRIEGHTDNTGDSSANLRLSAQRAMAIEAKLIAANVSRKRLDAVGVGGLQPLADNKTAEGRERNRRIELVMWQKYPAFHASAPNGKNYYPTSSDSAKNGL